MADLQSAATLPQLVSDSTTSEKPTPALALQLTFSGPSPGPIDLAKARLKEAIDKAGTIPKAIEAAIVHLLNTFPKPQA